MSDQQPRSPKGIPTGGQFTATAKAEAGVSLSRTDAFLARHAAEMTRQFRADVLGTARDYRGEATHRDADYIGTANLSYLAYQVAEISENQDLIFKVEAACEVLEENPGDRAARDTCAEIVRAHAATLAESGSTDAERTR